MQSFKSIKELARELRKNPTPSEERLWEVLRKKKLAVELDGKVHEYQQSYDEQRDFILQKKNLHTLRIANRDLANIEKVKHRILNYLR